MRRVAEDFCGAESIPKREQIKNRNLEMHEKYAKAGRHRGYSYFPIDPKDQKIFFILIFL